MTPARKLRIFRVKDGVRIPYTLELDHELTVIAEYADMADVVHVAMGRQQGTARVADDPVRRIATAMARWSSRSVEENPFPGSEALREEFFAAKSEMEVSSDGKWRECPPCEIGKLMRKYRDKLDRAGHLDLLK